ncbi:MAG: formate dehydrogenase subunit delta [Novosphingobium sp.]
MANQIARNFAVQGEDKAVAETARHILDFWDPRMKAQLFSCGEADLSPLAARAVARLRTKEEGVSGRSG